MVFSEELVNLPNKDKIIRLEDEMKKLPQTEELVTDHYFSEEMYCRRVFRPAGTVIVGKVHKAPHFFICAKGQIAVLTENGVKTLNAGDVVCSLPGTKRVTFALTDAVGITIHHTKNTEVDEIEKELLEYDPSALFDSNNNIKPELISQIKELSETVL